MHYNCIWCFKKDSEWNIARVSSYTTPVIHHNIQNHNRFITKRDKEILTFKNLQYLLNKYIYCINYSPIYRDNNMVNTALNSHLMNTNFYSIKRNSRKSRKKSIWGRLLQDEFPNYPHFSRIIYWSNEFKNDGFQCK